MIHNSLGIFIGVLATSFAWTAQLAAATWVDTDKISNSRNLQMQVDIDSVNYKGDWIYFLQRIKILDDSKAYKPWDVGINCSKGVLVERFSGSDEYESTQFRRNGKWFIDFANRNDPSDVFSVEVEAEDDAYREKSYSFICNKYNRQQ